MSQEAATLSGASLMDARPPADRGATGAPPVARTRVQAVDVLRGLVMVIMALDHTRDFVHAAAMSSYQQTLNGFVVRGQAPRRRWTVNDAERARTGIEQLLIDEGAGNTGTVFLRDVRTDFWDESFGVVSAEIIVGVGSLGDKLTGTAQLVEIPQSSGKWRFHREP